MSDYVIGKLAEFIGDYEGEEIDTSYTYGAQSPDLAGVYVSRLLGRTWFFPYAAAADLWEDGRGVMTAAGFERVTEKFETGDLAVFGKTHGGGYGTLGIITGIATDFGIEVFTQTPGPARRMTLHATSMLGAWRFTAAAECKALAGVYADKLQTRRDHRVIEQMKADEWAAGLTCPPGDLTPYELKQHFIEADPVKGWGEPAWLKRVETTRPDEWRPGDVALWDGVPDQRLGHVEIAQGRHFGKRSLLARLKALFGRA